MTVDVTRTFELDYSCEDVWDVLSDHDKRADAVSFVEDWEVHSVREATWQLTLPIPFFGKTVAVRTEEVVREEPTHIRFTGDSSVMELLGEHQLEEMEDGGCRVTNYFEVEGSFPGVEKFFKANLDGEIEHLRDCLYEELEQS